jgi:predicted acylesterase/phospholipase RssA
MSTERERLIQEAKRILRGELSAAPDELIERAKALESNRALRQARLLLTRARAQTPADDPLQRTIAHRLARCTYKDPDLPAFDRLDEAERILAGSDDPARSDDQETLGLAGAIQKRKWEVYGQRHFLDVALAYYRRGFDLGPERDSGYTGINAAFVLDLLAHDEEAEAARAGAGSPQAGGRRAEAQRIRETIADVLERRQPESHDWWSTVTAAEAYFGLGRYDEARAWLERADAFARSNGVPGWQRESTARQLAMLHRLQFGALASPQEFAGSPAGAALLVLLGNSLPAVLGAYRGKVGLALSGGGFRAALFHIGVLARLAELDALRHIEVLSCVSGGSIIGAHYYLELRTLLETKPDHLIDRQDYIDIVRRIERDFLAGVQANVRMRMIGNVVANVRMLFSRGYSRTHRVGELYEQRIYSLVGDGNGRTPRWLNGLFMRPHGEGLGFHPSYDNWHRSNKVPALVLNATSLNTGHAWQFTASWMGEPPATLDDDVDCNDRYRRMYYGEAPSKYRSFRLGYAVAASSCVPGLFEPLPLVDLYPGRVVQLVDGGVHDNQGIASLLEQNCDVILVSDASGQMSSIDAPASGILKVPTRSNSILMARVREAQYRELAARKRSGTLRGLVFLHLKKDLHVSDVDWIGCDDPPSATEHAEVTGYGVRRELQAKLAAVRTDLDSFTDLEAYALMGSGYRMAARELGDRLPDLAAPNGAAAWRFRAVEPLLAGNGDAALTRRLDKTLDVAGARALKVWRLIPALGVMRFIIIAAAIAGAAWFLFANRAEVAIHLTWGDVLRKIAPVVVTVLLGGWVAKAIWVRSTFTQFLVRLAVVVVGWLVALVHLAVFDRLYLRYGRVVTAGDEARSAEGEPIVRVRPPRAEERKIVETVVPARKE